MLYMDAIFNGLQHPSSLSHVFSDFQGPYYLTAVVFF